MAADRVTDAMVEAFCLSYWHGDWPYDKNEAERELCNELRANVRAGMSAALRAEAGAVVVPDCGYESCDCRSYCKKQQEAALAKARRTDRE